MPYTNLIDLDKVTAYWEELDSTYGKLIVSPLPRGYATTIGNALRRILLSSIEGAGVTAVKIDGIYHEFTSLPGAIEDVTDVVLNLKSLIVRLQPGTDIEVLYLEKEGPGEVKAGDIKTPPTVEILNPELHLFTLTDQNAKVKMEIRVERGRGYIPVEDMEQFGEVGWIAIDCDFNPVKKVAFKVEPTRVDRKTNFEKLILEVWTNGAKAPDVAVQEAREILLNYLQPLKEISKEIPQAPTKVEKDELEEKLTLSVEELDISARALNSLKKYGIHTLGDLVKLTEEELKETKNIGRKALMEIKKALQELGLSLGMNINYKGGQK
ncbi:MAG: DNA-directed RNA polymerase subunit alpha [Gammaproteobacteria bacterium]|nr:MAG: DNA-directed RNA polymerase subunit alpha [Gammaproteobacteria bacterium]